MHVFLSALAGISVAGAVVTPSLASTNHLTEHQTVNPQSEGYRISFGQHQELKVTQGGMSWSADFPFFANRPINQIQFDAGFLVAGVWWGTDHWVYSFPTINVQSGQIGQWVELYRDNHEDFLATQTSWLQYRLTQVNAVSSEWTYKLEFNFFAAADNTFTDCTGVLSIGSEMLVITNS